MFFKQNKISEKVKRLSYLQNKLDNIISDDSYNINPSLAKMANMVDSKYKFMCGGNYGLYKLIYNYIESNNYAFQSSNFSKDIEDIDITIELLTNFRDKMAYHLKHEKEAKELNSEISQIKEELNIY